MKQVPIELYGAAVICCEDSCTLNKLCTNHYTAGDYRSEWGVRPELQGVTVEEGRTNGTVFCKTYNITYEVGYDEVNDPLLVGHGEMVLLDDINPQLPLL